VTNRKRGKNISHSHTLYQKITSDFQKQNKTIEMNGKSAKIDDSKNEN
jgi:hypothetical protein